MRFVRTMNVRTEDGSPKLKVGMANRFAARCARDAIGDLFCNAPSAMCTYARIVAAIAYDECLKRYDR